MLKDLSLESLPWPTIDGALLPPKVRKFTAAEAPRAARNMAARGALPLAAVELVSTLAALAGGEDEAASIARESLSNLPLPVMREAAPKLALAEALQAIAKACASQPEILRLVSANKATNDQTFVALATTPDRETLDILANNQVRMLAVPLAIECLYFNPLASSVLLDRLIELAGREGVPLTGIPALEEHQTALAASDEVSALAAEAFEATLAEAQLAANGEAELANEDIAEATLKDAKSKPIATLIGKMNMAQKIRLATLGNASARAVLVRDGAKNVALAAIKSPAVSVGEATAYARSKEVAEDVLRFIGNKRDWMRYYEVKHALVANPKAPTALALRLVNHLRDKDVRALSTSRNIPAAVKNAAIQRLKTRAG